MLRWVLLRKVPGCIIELSQCSGRMEIVLRLCQPSYLALPANAFASYAYACRPETVIPIIRSIAPDANWSLITPSLTFALSLIINVRRAVDIEPPTTVIIDLAFEIIRGHQQFKAKFWRNFHIGHILRVLVLFGPVEIQADFIENNAT